MNRQFSLLSEEDIYLLNEGTHARLYDKLGAHLIKEQTVNGVFFAVWAPNAAQVSVIGDFNKWQPGMDPLVPRGQSGVWEGLIPGVAVGSLYKFHVRPARSEYSADRPDPVAFLTETPPGTASRVCDLTYKWNDDDWLADRQRRDWRSQPVAIYEVHLGSWRRDGSNRWLDYRELGRQLPDYVVEMGFTHVEFLPVMEHASYESWGYQTTGYFAPTSRYGSPQDFMFLIDQLHQRGIGVILDWVPSHFSDGEQAQVHERIHPDTNNLTYDYGRPELRSFLLSCAAFWLDKYHVDALRVGAVTSLVHPDYSLPDEFIPDLVSHPSDIRSLGLGFKWDTGWMHDTLDYMSQDPLFRKYHHHQLTARTSSAFLESFILPLPHDEVVHGKSSLISKMPGDRWQKFANLRLLYAYMWALPGKKLLFMGGEFGQWSEWNYHAQLDWSLLESDGHGQIRMLIGSLNHLYKSELGLHERETERTAFQWIDCHDSERNVISFLRTPERPAGSILVVCNFSPVPRTNYRLGVPLSGAWEEILNTDSSEFGGSGVGNLGGAETVPIPLHGHLDSLTITLPPLAAVIFRWST